MNTLKQLVWVSLLLGWSSCNRFTDEQPTPDKGPQAGAVQALMQQYPQAQDIVYTTIAPNQLWQATFTQQRQRYRALTSSTQLLTADQLIDGALPDSLTRLLESTVVSGGVFGNPRFRRYEWYSTLVSSGQFVSVFADYTWQQEPYTAYWSLTRLADERRVYNFYLLPRQQIDYHTKTLTDLPEVIGASLRAQNMTFTYAVVQVDALRRRRYTVSAQQLSAPPMEQFWQLIYDGDGQLLTAANQATAQFFQQADQLPPVIQQALQRPELAGFSLGGMYGTTARHTYGSLTTYWVSLQKDKQAWQLILSDKGQLISRSFLTVGTF